MGQTRKKLCVSVGENCPTFFANRLIPLHYSTPVVSTIKIMGLGQRLRMLPRRVFASMATAGNLLQISRLEAAPASPPAFIEGVENGTKAIRRAGSAIVAPRNLAQSGAQPNETI